jgi:thioredoxin reductase (NADPH)
MASPLPVCIIGAGPCGLAAAIALKQAGIPAVVTEQGCLVSSVAQYPTYITFFSTAEKISIGGLPLPIAGDKPTRREAMAYYRAATAHYGLEVRQYERVTSVRRTDDHFVVTSVPQGGEPRELACRAVVVATGYFGTPNKLNVPGEELPHVTHFFREGHDGFQQDVVVVGGGNSAVEAALDLYRCGARTTIVHFGSTWDKNIKPWILPDVTNRMSEGAIGVRWNARVREIRPRDVVLDVEGHTELLPASLVYLMTGYTPHGTLLGQLGVAVDPLTGVPAHDPETMQTPVPGVFIAGVLASGFDANKIFIENGRDHGALIAKALA